MVRIITFPWEKWSLWYWNTSRLFPIRRFQKERHNEPVCTFQHLWSHQFGQYPQHYWQKCSPTKAAGPHCSTSLQLFFSLLCVSITMTLLTLLMPLKSYLERKTADKTLTQGLHREQTWILEAVWYHLDRERNKRQSKSKEELWEVLKEAWYTYMRLTLYPIFCLWTACMERDFEQFNGNSTCAQYELHVALSAITRGRDRLGKIEQPLPTWVFCHRSCFHWLTQEKSSFTFPLYLVSGFGKMNRNFNTWKLCSFTK